jgi:[ribosomal protein S5]-alanine N-acetyltransferase
MPIRVELRPPVPDDEAAWCALIRGSRDSFAGWFGSAGTPAEFARYLERSRSPSAACRLIRRRADDALLGAINLSEIVRGVFQSGSLGYYIGAPYHGQGYMTDALGLMLRLAFGGLRLHRLEANIQPGNTASLALVRRAGFRREGSSPRYLKVAGRWRDHERWALLVEDWHVQRRHRRS